MKINELVEKINDSGFDFEKDLEIKTYLPIELKKTIAQSIIYECASEESGAIKIDSVQKYMSYIRYMITSHTNLEYVDEDYDVLCSTIVGYKSLRDVIMRCFDDDATECKRILNYMVNDYMRENGFEYAAAGFVNNLNAKLSDLSKVILDNVGNLADNNLIPEGVDMDKISGFLNQYIK